MPYPAKYVVLPYSIDAVSTLSYQINLIWDIDEIKYCLFDFNRCIYISKQMIPIYLHIPNEGEQLD